MYRGTNISIIVCLLRFAELFACVAFRISLLAMVFTVFILFFTFAEAYHDLFDSTMALRNTFYAKS